MTVRHQNIFYSNYGSILYLFPVTMTCSSKLHNFHTHPVIPLRVVITLKFCSTGYIICLEPISIWYQNVRDVHVNEQNNVIFVAFRFVDNSTKMSFVNFMSVLSVFRIHRPDTIWFHCNRLPDASDVHWDQLWKSVPLKIIYHKQQTDRDVLESGLMLARDSAVVATLLEHGGIFINWNILVVQSLNPLRNYSTCFSKVCLPFITIMLIAV